MNKFYRVVPLSITEGTAIVHFDAFSGVYVCILAKALSTIRSEVRLGYKMAALELVYW